MEKDAREVGHRRRLSGKAGERDDRWSWMYGVWEAEEGRVMPQLAAPAPQPLLLPSTGHFLCKELPTFRATILARQAPTLLPILNVHALPPHYC